MKREGSEEEQEEEFEQHKQRRLERIRDTLITQLRDYGQGAILMEIVKYLSVEDAYALSQMDKELNRFFREHGVWEAYATDRLRRIWRTHPETLIARFELDYVPHVNYLWLLLIQEYAMRFDERKVSFRHDVNHSIPTVTTNTMLHGYTTIRIHGVDEDLQRRLDRRIESHLKSIGMQWFSNKTTEILVKDTNVARILYMLFEAGLYMDFGSHGRTFWIRSQLIGAGGTTKRERGEEKEYENCENEEDPLTHQPITELDPEAVVHIGPHCFDVEMIWFWVKRDPTNPITNERFTDEQVERIYEQYLRWSEVKLERQGHPLPRPIHRLLEIYYRAVEERVGERPRLLLTFVVGGQYYRLYTSPLDQVQYLRQLVYNYILTRDPKIMIEWRRYYNAKPNPNIIRIFHGDRELLNDRRIEEYGLGNNTLLTLGQTIMDPKPWVY